MLAQYAHFPHVVPMNMLGKPVSFNGSSIHGPNYTVAHILAPLKTKSRCRGRQMAWVTFQYIPMSVNNLLSCCRIYCYENNVVF